MSELPFVGLLIVIGLALTVNNYFNYDVVHVTIDKGILRGFNTTTWRGVPYFGFKGIPYAQPPLGELRFRAPQEEAAWAGVRNSFGHGNVCPQIDMVFRRYRGDEDCLFVNVYTPSLKDDRMAVMVFIHGGIFMFGSGNDELFGPDYFMEAEVVLVTMNYRLGALGFLSTGDDGAPGNAGLKDQVAALRWVRRNIAKFGGDPDNVTIFGGSSGAVCVQLHVLSPLSAGLFTRAVGQSATAINTWGLHENGPELTMRLVEGLGIKDIGGDTAKALEFLKIAPATDIVRMQTAIITAEEVRTRVPSLFRPTVERSVQSEEIFMSARPVDVLKSGNFSAVPYITGYTSHEGYFFIEDILNFKLSNTAIKDMEAYVPLDIKNEVFREELARSIGTFYFNDSSVTTENVNNYINLISDTTFLAAMRRATKLHLLSSTPPIYFYVFSHDGKKNILKSFFNVQMPESHLRMYDDLTEHKCLCVAIGAAHGDELGYLFHQELLFWNRPPVGSEDEYVIQTMIRLWTNFAKYGNPTPAGDVLNWKPATLDEFNYLNISGRDMKMNVDPDSDRMNFWAEAYEKCDSL